MNICIITPRYPYKKNMEFVFVKKLVDEWARMGHRCVVISVFSWITFFRKRTEYRPNHYRDEVAPGIFVDIYNPRIITTKLFWGDVSFDTWIASCAIERTIQKLGICFDLIYCHFFISSLIAFRYAKRNNIPFFISTGESHIGQLNKPYRAFSWKDFRDYTKGVISVSTKNKIEAVEKGLIDAEKCKVFPNGTDLNIFRRLDRIECRNKLGFPLNAFIVSCVGFFCERKGQRRVLEAVRRLGDKDVKIIYIGNSTKQESIELEGDEILFMDSVENKDLPFYLCSSDIFCLPTLAEGCCNAVIEALACGLPVISSDFFFNRDILNSNNSILIDPQNIDDITIAIRTLRDDVNYRQLLGSQAYVDAKSLSVQKRAEEILKYMVAVLPH